MKLTKEGWAVLDGDTHIGKWVEELGRLDIQEGQIKPWLFNVPENGIIIDAGACYGDTAATFSQHCGKKGWIYAFEPNMGLYECLRHNARMLEGVVPVNYGLGKENCIAIPVNNANAGASKIERVDSAESGITVIRIDDFDFNGKVNFIKIDCEGWETDIIDGAERTIINDKPDMLIEVNEWALKLHGSSRESLLRRIERLGYVWTITDDRLSVNDPQYDVFCTSK